MTVRSEKSGQKLAELRKSIASHELVGDVAATVPVGHACADAMLRGGLRHGALHEVYAGDASQAGPATGFASGFASRLSARKTLFWISTDYAALEYGGLSASGLIELGIDPSRIVVLRMAKGDDALRASGDVLACASVGAVVIEIERHLQSLDLTASRRLSLAAAKRDVPAVILRIASKPEPSAADTRWLIHAADSPPLTETDDFGAPQFDVRLIRNRRGENGEWRLAWDCSNGLFGDTKDRKRAADTIRLAAALADRPVAAKEAARQAV
jgi:protein ImuA